MKTRWQRRIIFMEAARSGLALVVTGIISLLQPLLSPWQLLLLPLVVLFASSFLNCVVRAMSEVSIDERGIRLSRGWLPQRALDWSDLVSVEVRVFPLGRYRKATLSDLKLRGQSTEMLIDDGLEGFRDVVAHAWREACARGIQTSDVTRTNLVSLGVMQAQEH
jgi:hypothetical protein